MSNGPFNDAGEPLMSASDYSRECESDYYERDEYDDRDGDRADAMAEEWHEKVYDPIKEKLELFGLTGTNDQINRVETYLTNEYIGEHKRYKFTGGRINDAIEDMLPDLQEMEIDVEGDEDE